MEQLEFENDVKLVIHAYDDDKDEPTSFEYLTNKTILGLYSEFFKKLFFYSKKSKETTQRTKISDKAEDNNDALLERVELTIDFPQSTIKKCLDSLHFVSTQNIFFYAFNTSSVYIFKDALNGMLSSDFITNIECLQYLQIKVQFLDYILVRFTRLLSAKEVDDFDINRFLALDCLSNETKWGFWSMYGDETNMPSKNSTTSPDNTIIPVSLNMLEYDGYHVLKIRKEFDFGENFKGKTRHTFEFNVDDFGLWIEFKRPNKTVKFDIQLIHCHPSKYPECKMSTKFELKPKESNDSSDDDFFTRKEITCGQGFYGEQEELEGEYIFLVKKCDD